MMKTLEEHIGASETDVQADSRGSRDCGMGVNIGNATQGLAR
jgi:hypothetical protein